MESIEAPLPFIGPGPPPPIPDEIISSVGILSSYLDDRIRAVWAEQFGRLSALMSAAAPLQAHWGSCIPPEIRPATGSINTLALFFLMDSLWLGGGRRVRQFIYGFDVTGAFARRAVFPRNLKIRPILDTDISARYHAARFSTGLRTPGFPHAGHIWAEAMEQGACGSLSAPVPFDSGGRAVVSDFDMANVVFRLSAFCRARKYGRATISNTTW